MIALPILLLLQADPRLDKPVDLRLEIVPIETAVAAMGRAAGLAMETSPAVRGAKTTILVKGLPLGRVMARVADVMRLRWSREGDAYRLVAGPEATAREGAFLRTDAETRRKALEKELRDKAAQAPASYAGVQDEIEELNGALETMRPDDPRRSAAYERLGVLNQNYDRGQWLQNRMLAGLSGAEWNRLLAGEILSASTAPSPGGRGLPTSVVGQALWRGGDEKVGGCEVFLRVDPETGKLMSRSDVTNANGQSASMSRTTATENTFTDFDGPLKATPFGKELLGWNMDDATLAKGPLASVMPKAETPERPSVWWAGYRSDADRLAWLHDATGLPVVALALRTPNRRSALRFSGSVAAEVKAWRSGGYGDAFRFEDGVLMHRPPEFWRRKAVEIPEPTLAILEAKSAPTLDDYADFAARITDRQGRFAGDPSSYLLKVSPYPLDDGLPVLRLWGTLTKAQRETLRNGGTLAYGALGSSAKAAFAHAVTDVFAGAWHKGAMASRFVGGTGSYGDWALFGETKNVSATGRARPRPFDASFNVDDENAMEPNSEGIRLTLGPSRTDGVQYTVALAGAPQKR